MEQPFYLAVLAGADNPSPVVVAADPAFTLEDRVADALARQHRLPPGSAYQARVWGPLRPGYETKSFDFMP